MNNRPKENKEPTFIRVWKDYGGWNALYGSSYARWALLLSVVVLIIPAGHSWWDAHPWWEVTFSVTPAILGFSLASLALFLTIGNTAFQRYIILAQLPGRTGAQDQPVSAYMDFISAFCWFLLSQTAGLLYAIVFNIVHPLFNLAVTDASCKCLLIYKVVSFPGIFLFLYGIMQVIAVTLRVYVLCQGYVKFTQLEEKEKKAPPSGKEGENTPPQG